MLTRKAITVVDSDWSILTDWAHTEYVSTSYLVRQAIGDYIEKHTNKTMVDGRYVINYKK